MARQVSSITLFTDKDVFPFKNKVEWLGFSKENTLGQMIDLAMQNDCNMITKNGGGKWYLKNEDYNEIIHRMNAQEDKYHRPRYITYVIKYT
ncbi:MAG: hypothetical protein EBQ72_00330 [Actinobacteria bacterium]|nr:hypothetical protein [Actinomycetota bacterium]